MSFTQTNVCAHSSRRRDFRRGLDAEDVVEEMYWTGVSWWTMSSRHPRDRSCERSRNGNGWRRCNRQIACALRSVCRLQRGIVAFGARVYRTVITRCGRVVCLKRVALRALDFVMASGDFLRVCFVTTVVQRTQMRTDRGQRTTTTLTK